MILKPENILIYHNAWSQIHRRPFEVECYNNEIVWLKRLIRSLPCGKCAYGAWCYLKDNTPDLKSQMGYFAWGVEFHNSINRKTGKPEMTAEDALKLYKPENP